MLNRILKRTLLVSCLYFAAIGGLSAQMELPPMQKGQFALKTNPLQYFYPEYNLSLELGTGDLRSLELKMAVFPFFDYRNNDRKSLRVLQASGFSVHLMRRHYQTANPSLFMAYGVMFKHWAYQDLDRLVDNFQVGGFNRVNEDRSAWVPGIKCLLGKRSSFLGGKGLVEVYAGLSMKLRFEAVSWTYLDGPPCQLDNCDGGVAGSVLPVPGINFGLNIGPRF